MVFGLFFSATNFGSLLGWLYSRGCLLELVWLRVGSLKVFILYLFVESQWSTFFGTASLPSLFGVCLGPAFSLVSRENLGCSTVLKLMLLVLSTLLGIWCCLRSLKITLLFTVYSLEVKMEVCILWWCSLSQSFCQVCLKSRYICITRVNSYDICLPHNWRPKINIDLQHMKR